MLVLIHLSGMGVSSHVFVALIISLMTRLFTFTCLVLVTCLLVSLLFFVQHYGK